MGHVKLLGKAKLVTWIAHGTVFRSVCSVDMFSKVGLLCVSP